MFDIRQEIRNEDGHEFVRDYIDGLMKEFAVSPEADEFLASYGRLSWSAMMMEYAINHVGVTPPDMTLADFEEVVFDLFPRKVSTEPESAARCIHELRAFWTFLQRQYGLANTAKILETLDDEAIVALQEKLADPANYGMAKSFVMAGMKAGYDMTTNEGSAAFMQVYNANLMASKLSAPSFPNLGEDYGLEKDLDPLPPSPMSWDERAKKRQEKKKQRKAKKRNRR